jgi:hypothetical protein
MGGVSPGLFLDTEHCMVLQAYADLSFRFLLNTVQSVEKAWEDGRLWAGESRTQTIPRVWW